MRSETSTTMTMITTRYRPARRAMIGIAAAILGLTLAGASTVEAQGRGHGNGHAKSKKVPPGHLPPAGQCRVWYDGTPPGHQPPPMNCSAAREEAYRTGGRVIYGGGDDRYDRDRRYDRRDRDRDGYCDERNRQGDDDCSYYPGGRYPGDPRYPDRYPSGGYPTSLPEMVWGVLTGQGRAPNLARQWVGTGDVRSRYTDSDRNGRPEVVSWYDAGGRLLQRWMDDNRDGRADRVALYGGDRLLRVIR